tara:strand:- start:530 stop:685 length:156 start_codon:yes stop_codon:yes gene_type:complete
MANLKSYYIYETRRYEVRAKSQEDAWIVLRDEGEDHCSVIENSIEEVKSGR